MEKIYVGNGKEITTKYGELLKISFSKDDLDKMYQMLNEKGWINLNVNRRKEVSQYGHTHSIQVDTYDGSNQQQSAPQQPQEAYNPDGMSDDYETPPHPQAQADFTQTQEHTTGTYIPPTNLSDATYTGQPPVQNDAQPNLDEQDVPF